MGIERHLTKNMGQLLPRFPLFLLRYLLVLFFRKLSLKWAQALTQTTSLRNLYTLLLLFGEIATAWLDSAPWNTKFLFLKG